MADPYKTTVTMDDLRKMYADMREREHNEAVRRGEDLTAFFASIPERFHGEKVVLEMAMIVRSGEPIHPNYAKRLRDELDRLLNG